MTTVTDGTDDVARDIERYVERLLQAHPAIDVTDTSGCGRPGRRCEACGSQGPGLAIIICQTAAGPTCVTADPDCAEALTAGGMLLPVARATAVKLALQHARHVGLA